MSEAAPEPTLAERRQVLAEQRESRVNPNYTPGGGGSGLSQKLLGVPYWGWIAIIAVGGGLVWYLFKRQQSSSSATTAQSSSSSTCLDAAGNNVPCNQVDYGGEIATLQTEIMDLQGATSGSSGSSGSSSSAPSIPVVQNLTVSSVSSSHVSLKWSPPPGTAWFYVVTYSTGSQNGPVSVTQTTSWTSPVLKSNTTYTFKVQVSPDSSGTQQLGPNATVSATTS